ncbi:hypothetical protein JZ751_029065 [Albula glossodonta]|uniref:RNA-binding protein 44 n=1 Tax=Albula glossodonta TaxID=121402 RepID=A0A8T2PGZ3_9TELE|nr:hypothetical protein JZ751_029065 [Albula glossodonta]
MNICTSQALGVSGQQRGTQSAPEQDPVLDESFQSACDTSLTTAAITYQQGPQRSPAHLLGHLCDEKAKRNSTVAMYKDPSAQASFSLDVELELHSRTPKASEMKGEETTDFPDLEKEVLPEYYSFNSTGEGMSFGKCGDISHLTGPEHNEYDLAAEGSFEQQGEAGICIGISYVEDCDSVASTPCCSEYTDWTEDNHLDDFGNEEDSRRNAKNEEYHSVMEEEPLENGGASWSSTRTPIQDSDLGVKGRELKLQLNTAPLTEMNKSSSLKNVHGNPCVGGLNQSSYRDSLAAAVVNRTGSTSASVCKKCVAKASLVTMNQTVDVSGDFRASYTSTRSTEARQSVESRSSNTEPLCPTQNAAVNTDHPPPHQCLLDQSTQTLAAPTAEKYVITDVYMSDLDYLTERAIRAELRLLSLQYGMCQQHCWRRYYTSPEGDSGLLRTEALPSSVKSVLLELEDDYCEMRMKIVSGVPLDQLHPLSVNSERLMSGALYIPAQIIDSFADDEVLEPEPSAQQPVDCGAEGESGGNLACSSSVALQNGQTDRAPAVKPKSGSAKHGRAGTLLTLPPGPPIGHKHGGAKDPDSSEAWFDAQEEIGPTTIVKGERQEGTEGSDCRDSLKTTSKGKQDNIYVVQVADLPSDIVEEEVMSCFRKYQASEVSLTPLSNGLRMAKLTVTCPSRAEAAVREQNGHTIRGHVIKVTSFHRPPDASSEVPGEKEKPKSGPFPRAGCMVDPPGSRAPKSSAPIVTAKPLRQRLEKLMNVQDSPTPSGTCVPQHYATMGSFDTLMARLSERHPEAGREKIVNALLELRAQHQGLLSGLPLKTIIEMTSELLTCPSTPKEV